MFIILYVNSIIVSVYSGFTLRTLRPCPAQKIEYPPSWEYSENPSDWLLFTSTRPLSLAALCRIKIRQLLGPNGQNLYKIKELGFPRSVENYLYLNDI